MPVGTAGAVKAVHHRELENDIGSNIILGNTYHLCLRPGMEVIRKAGGLHKFMGWNRAILTDSGGYQVYSLAEKRKISEEGVEFSSHIDGNRYFFSPEKAIDIQRTIGADIIMAFDECTPYPCDYEYAKKSMDLTHRWLKRCMEQFSAGRGLYGFDQVLFPIIQGSTYAGLRRLSALEAAACDSPGCAIGGLSVGESHREMYDSVRSVVEVLPEEKVRYLMGVGTPANLLECIGLGIDMFDCVMPTRNGRNGMIFTANGVINIRNEKWKDDFSPLDESGYCFADLSYSKAYLRHLMMSNEMLGSQIASLHNLAFYHWLMKEAAKRIGEGNYLGWKEEMVEKTEAKR